MSYKNIVRTFLGLGIFIMLFVIFIKVCNQQGENQFEDLSEAKKSIYTVGEAKGKEEVDQARIGQYTVNDVSKPNINDKKKANKNRLESGLSTGSKRHLSSVKPVNIKDLSEIRTKAGFFENKGQFQNEQIDFVLKRRGLKMVLSGNAIQYQLLYETQTDGGTEYLSDVIDLTFVGANEKAQIETFGESHDKHNYFLGEVKATDVHHFKQVLYKELYPGIDLLFEAFDPERERFGAKYSFIVKPGADPNQIKVKYTGQKGLSTTESTGDRNFVDVADLMEISTSGGAIGEKITSIYTVDDNDNKAFVPGQFVKKDGLIEYDIDGYDQSKMLVIDPEVVTLYRRKSTYYGSNQKDQLTGVSSGSDGSLYVVGVVSKSEDSETINITRNGYRDELAGNNDLIIARFQADLSDLISATYLGGDGDDQGFDIKVSSTKVFVVGYTTSTNFPANNGSFKSNGGLDIMISAFNTELNDLNWTLGIGGERRDIGNALTFSNGSLFFIGSSESSGLQTIDRIEHNDNNRSEAVLGKINSISGELEWFTYNGIERSTGDAIAGTSEKIYLAGQVVEPARSQGNILVEEYNFDGLKIRTEELDFNGLVMEIHDLESNNDGEKLALVGTIFGELDSDLAEIPNLVHQKNYGGGQSDGLLLQLNSNNFTIDWATYYGGEDDAGRYDELVSVTYDCNENIVASGYSTSPNNISNNGFVNSYQGGAQNDDDEGDAILVKFNKSGERYWGSYFGAAGNDAGLAISLSTTGNILMCGSTESDDKITTDDTYDSEYLDKGKGGTVGFISTFCDILIPNPPTNKVVTYNSNVTFSVGIDYCGEENATYSWTGPSGLISDADQEDLILNNVTDADAGRYCVTITTPCGSETVCARLRVVSLIGNNVCLDTESELNATAPDQELIKLDFPDIAIYDVEVDTNTISNIQYKWSVSPTTGSNKVVDPDNRSEILRLNMTDFRADFRTIYVSPEVAGNYTYTLELKYNDALQDPVEVTDMTTVSIEVYDHPTLDPVSDVVLCEGERSSINLISDLDLAQYQWELTDDSGGNISISGGNSGTESNINAKTDVFEKVFELEDNVTTDQSGVLRIIPTSNNNDCLGDPIDINITVKPRANLTADDNGQSTYCSGDQITINFDAEGFSGTTFSWNRAAVTDVSPNTSSDEDLSAGSLTETLTNVSNSKKTVTYNISGDFNGCTSDISQSVTILPTSTVNDISDQEVCNEDAFSVSITTDITDSDAIGYHIVVGENTNISGQSDVDEAPAHDSNSPISFSQTLTNETNIDQILTYTVTPYQLDSEGDECPGEAMSFKVTVRPTADIIVNEIGACEGAAVNLDFSSIVDGTNITYEMSLDAGLSYSEVLSGAVQNRGRLTGSFSFNESSPTSSLSATVSFSTEYNNCAGDSKQITITVQPQPDVTISGSTIICGDQPASLVATTQLSSVSYQWFGPNDLELEISGATSESFDPSDPGAYRVEVTDTNSNCTNSETVNVTKPSPVVFDADITSSGGDDVCAEDGVELSVNITSGTPDSLQWERKLQNGIYEAIEGENKATLIVTRGGIYRIAINPGSACEQFSNDKEIIFSSLPDIEIISSKVNFCPNEQVTLNSTIIENGATISSVEWTNNPANGAVSITTEGNNDQNPVIIFTDYTGTTALEFDVIMRVETADGCLKSDTISLTLNPNPAASFTLDDTFCQSTNAFITPKNASERGANYTWTVTRDGENLSEQIINDATLSEPEFRFPANESALDISYLVRMDVVSDKGCSQSLSKTVNVQPQPEMIISGDINACSGTTLNLNSDQSRTKTENRFSSQIWVVNGEERSTESTFDLLLSNSGTENFKYEILLIGENTNGCIDTTSTTVNAFPNAKAEFSMNNLTGCSPFDIKTTGGLSDAVDYPEANDADGYIWKYYLDGSNDPIVTQTGITPPDYILNAADQALRVELSVSSLHSCDESVLTQIFKTYADPVPAFSYPATICAKETLKFTDLSALTNSNDIPNNAIYNWDFGDGSNASEREPSHIFENQSNNKDAFYTVKLSIEIGEGCIRETELIVTVSPLPKAEFTLDNSCAGSTISPINTSVGNNLQYQWTANSEDVIFQDSESASPQIVFKDSQGGDQAYDILLTTTSDKGCSSTFSTSVNVAGRPAAVIEPIESPSCNNELEVSGINSSGDDLTYLWQVIYNDEAPTDEYFLDAQSQETTLTLPSNTNQGNDDYTIRLIVSSEGCTDTTSTNFTLNPQPFISFNTSSTVICDGEKLSFENISQSFEEGDQTLTFEWRIDGEVLSTEENFDYQFDKSITVKDTFEVSLGGKSISNCTNTYKQKIIVYPNAKARFSTVLLENCAPFSIGENSNVIPEILVEANAQYIWRILDEEANELQVFEGLNSLDYIIQTAETTINLQLITTPLREGCANDTSSLVSFTTFPESKAGFEVPQNPVCEDALVDFNDLLTVNADSIVWKFGDGTTSSLRTTQYSFINTSFIKDTIYQITQYTYTDKKCIDSLSREITILPKPRALFYLQNACGGDTITIDNQSLGKGALAYSWTSAPSADIEILDATTDNPRFVIISENQADLNYEISLQVTSSDGCVATHKQTLVVFGDPTANISSETLICANSEEVFTSLEPAISSVLAPDSLYIWNFGDGYVDTVKAPQRATQHIYLDTGNYLMTLAVMNLGGCIDIDSLQLRVIDTPVAKFLKTIRSFDLSESNLKGSLTGVDNDRICGPKVKFTAENLSFEYGAGETYEWNFGRGKNDTSSEKNPGEILFLQNDFKDTTYQVSLTVTNQCESSTFIDEITIIPSPIADFTFEWQYGCDEIPSRIINNSRGTPTTYYWNFGDGTPIFTTQDSQPIEHIFDNTGLLDTTYFITLVAESECGLDTLTKPFTIIPNDIRAEATIGANDNYFCIGEDITLVANGVTASNADIRWITSNGLLFEDQEEITLSFDQVGQYDIILHVFVPLCGNSATDTIQVEIQAGPDIDFIVSDTVCFGEYISVENTSIDQLPTTVWNFGDGRGFIGLQPDAILYTEAGNYDIEMSLRSANNCESEVIKTVVIEPLVTPDLILTEEVRCQGYKYVFSALNNTIIPDGYNPSYHWYLNDSLIGKEYDLPPFTLFADSLIIVSYHLNFEMSYGKCGISWQKTFETAIFDVEIDIESSNNYLCVNEEITFNAIGVTDTTAQINWNFGDGNVAFGNITVDHSYSTPGTYQVLLSTFLPECEISSRDTFRIVVEAGPVINFKIPEKVCTESIVIIENTGEVNSVNTTWNLGIGSPFVGTLPENVQYNTSGTYNVTMSLTGSNGCVTQLSKEIIVQDPPEVGFELPDIICQSLPLTFVNITKYAMSYQWTVDKLADTTYAIDYYQIINEVGTYEITLEAYADPNLQGCMASVTKTFKVENSPEVSIEIKDDKVCQFESVRVGNLTIDGNGNSWYLKDFFTNENILNLGTTTGLDSLQFNASKAGTFKVVLESSSVNGCKVVGYDTLVVYPEIKPVIDTLSQDVCGGAIFTFENRTTIPDSLNSIFSWYRDSLLLGNTYNPQPQTFYGQYLIYQESVISVDLSYEECQFREDITIDIPALLDCDFVLPNAFTPNNDGYNDYAKVIIHPNTRKNLLKIEIDVFNAAENLIASIYMSRASVELPMQCTKGCDAMFDAENWYEYAHWNGEIGQGPAPRGMYMMKVSTDCCSSDPRARTGYIQLIKD